MKRLYTHLTVVLLSIGVTSAKADSFNVSSYVQNDATIDLSVQITCGGNKWQPITIPSGTKMTLQQSNCPSQSFSLAIQTEGFATHIYTLGHGQKFMLFKNGQDAQLAGPFDAMPRVPLLSGARSTDMYGNQPAPRAPLGPGSGSY